MKKGCFFNVDLVYLKYRILRKKIKKGEVWIG